MVRQIALSALIPVQLGGGIRDLATIKRVLSTGIERVVLGTAAVEDAALLTEACDKYGDYLAVSIDARDGRIATWGWREDSGIGAVDFAGRMQAAGVQRLIYTDIARDGTLTEPNFDAVAELVRATPLPVTAAGGVSSVLDVSALDKLGVAGVIIGKALYTGDIDLKAALRAVEHV